MLKQVLAKNLQKPKLRKLALSILSSLAQCGWRSNSAQFLTVFFQDFYAQMLKAGRAVLFANG
jgi:hypothetical protein